VFTAVPSSAGAGAVPSFRIATTPTTAAIAITAATAKAPNFLLRAERTCLVCWRSRAPGSGDFCCVTIR
jgi:hypothetical protein